MCWSDCTGPGARRVVRIQQNPLGSLTQASEDTAAGALAGEAAVATQTATGHPLCEIWVSM